MQGRFRVETIIRAIWLFLQVGGPFPGCPHNNSLTVFWSMLGPLILETPTVFWEGTLEVQHTEGR